MVNEARVALKKNLEKHKRSKCMFLIKNVDEETRLIADRVASLIP